MTSANTQSLTENELTALGYLRDHVENYEGDWGPVQIDSAKPNDWSLSDWYISLGGLVDLGLFVPYESYGLVKL